MKRPLIGISSNIIIDGSGDFAGYRRSYVNTDYIESVVTNGGTPLILPFCEDETAIRQQVQTVDGLLLSGGQDVSPHLYGEEPSQRIGDTFPARDVYEFTLIEEALRQNKPILGICRGMQILNTYFKGSLYQDLSEIPGTVYKHNQQRQPRLVTHHVDIKKDSLLYQIFAVEELMVNSFHHQAVKKLGEGLKLSAAAKDGVVEAFEKPDYPYLLAVQWHPEMLHESTKAMNKIFQSLVEASNNTK